jgi:iron(III) transport system ATP-binding protein
MIASAASVGIRLEGVTKVFDANTVIDNIDLTIKPGSLTTLLGPSGCGKTTILRLIAGLETATAGHIWIGDQDVTDLSASHRDVAMVFQSYALFPHMTVGENVGYGLKVQKVPKAEREKRVAKALADVGLAGFEERYIDQMSGGQQQRVAVARALILEPKVMLFDEPLSNLDTKLRRSMREDIRQLQQKTGITSVYVTHDQSEALAVSDEVVVMDAGLIAQIGSPEDLYRRPSSAFVATFMGEANILEADVSRQGQSLVVVIDGARLELDDTRAGLPEGKARVAVRPESIRLVPEGAAPGPSGTVKACSYVGAATEYEIDCDGGEVFAVVPAGAPVFGPGRRVALAIDSTGVAVFAEFDAGNIPAGEKKPILA